MIRIENWSIIKATNTDFDAPEIKKIYFAGNVYGHPFFHNGDKVITSRIVKYIDGIFHTSSGREYKLGKVDEKYEAEYPNAYNRVIKSLG